MILQVVSAVSLIATILLQKRGGGLGGAFGGLGTSYYTKRGMEKFIFQATIASAVVFLGVSLMRIIK